MRLRNSWYLPSTTASARPYRLDEHSIEGSLDFEVPEPPLTQAEEIKVITAMKKSIRLSSLTLDLFLWELIVIEEKQLESLMSVLSEAPAGSPAFKMMQNEKIMGKIKSYSMPKTALIKLSKLDLEIGVAEELLCLGDWGYYDEAYRLIDAEPFYFKSSVNMEDYERRQYFRWLQYGITDLTVRYQWRIIQRLPRARELLREKIEELEADVGGWIQTPPNSEDDMSE